MMKELIFSTLKNMKNLIFAIFKNKTKVQLEMKKKSDRVLSIIMHGENKSFYDADFPMFLTRWEFENEVARERKFGSLTTEGQETVKTLFWRLENLDSLIIEKINIGIPVPPGETVKSLKKKIKRKKILKNLEKTLADL